MVHGRQKSICRRNPGNCKSEEVYLAASGKTFSEAEKLAQRLQTDEALYPIRVFEAETDDAWARDVGPTFVTDGQEVRGINWEFNAWGGTEDGLYASWEKDNRFAPFFARKRDTPGMTQGRLCWKAVLSTAMEREP